MKTPAIILGCHKLGLGVIRSLGTNGIPVIGVYYNNHDMGYVSRYITESHQCPRPDTDETGFISFLIKLSQKWKNSVLIPSDDGTLVAVSKHRSLLDEYYRISCCGWEIVRRCIEKSETYALARELGIPCPSTFTPENIDDAARFGNQIGYPCLLKPVIGHLFFEHFRKKMFFVKDETQLINDLGNCESAGMKMMIQEYIPGPDTSGVNYNSFIGINGKRIEFTAEKVRLSPERFGFPRVVISKEIPGILKPGRNILDNLHFTGFSCMEFKNDERDGVYKLMEINPRQNLSSMLAVKCGINFPYISYCDSAGMELPAYEENFRKRVFWIDLEKEILELFRLKKFGREPISRFFKPYLKKKVFVVASLSDPKPMLKRFMDFLKSLFIHSAPGTKSSRGGKYEDRFNEIGER